MSRAPSRNVPADARQTFPSGWPTRIVFALLSANQFAAADTVSSLAL